MRERSERKEGLAQQKEEILTDFAFFSDAKLLFLKFTLQIPLSPPKSYGFCFLSTLACVRGRDGEGMVIIFPSFFKVLGHSSLL